MPNVKAMSAQYTPITIEEMDTFLRRAFRALRPKKGVERGEIVYDLFLTPVIGIRVWTSLSPHSGESAGVGSDAIRVQYFHFGRNHPLVRGKAPIVKRTQGWRENLKERIEDYMELFEQREADLEAQRGGG